MERNSKMKKILFIVPHPDDELVGSCCLIRRYLKDGKKIYLFFITNGVLSHETLWFWQRSHIKKMIDLRKREMNLSIKKLGIKEFFFQNIPTRTLKDKIFETYKKINKIK